MSKMAIAYAMKKKANKKMAEGGGVDAAQDSMRKAFHFAEGTAKPIEPIQETDKRKEFEDSYRAANSASTLGKLKTLVGLGIDKKAHGGMVYDVTGPDELLHKQDDFNMVPNKPQFKWNDAAKDLRNVAASHEDGKDLNQHYPDMQDSTSMAEEDIVDRIMNKKSMTYEGLDRLAQGGRVGTKSSDILETIKGSTPGSSGKYSQGAHARSGKKHTDIGNKYGNSIHKEMGRESTREAKEIAAHKAYEISQQNPKLKGLADGGYVDDEDDMVSRIMHKRNEPFSDLDRYSQGGKISNDVGTGQEADKLPNQYDDLVLRDDLESSYGDDDNSGDALGNSQEDEDRKDIVSRIMASRRKKDRLPNPA